MNIQKVSPLDSKPNPSTIYCASSSEYVIRGKENYTVQPKRKDRRVLIRPSSSQCRPSELLDLN